MARTDVTVQRVTRDGITPTYESANVDGHTVPNDSGKIHLHIKNTDTSAHNVTVQTSRTVSGFAIADHTVSVGAGSELMLGGFPSTVFGDDLLVDFASTTGMSIAALGV